MTHPPERPSASDVANERAAVRDLLPGLVLLLVTEASLLVADPEASAGGWTMAWSLSPLVAVGLLVWGQVRILQRADERERSVQLAAMAVGFGVLATLLASVGVLRGAGVGDATQQLQLTFIAGIGAWIAALEVGRRRAS
ncbi:MAG: hypothetical protein ACOYOP_15950 [Microthrixaceae bacterium]